MKKRYLWVLVVVLLLMGAQGICGEKEDGWTSGWTPVPPTSTDAPPKW